jgi:hypothetical protein
MPKTTEFNIQMEDQPGTLAKFSRALADKGVNILGFQSFPAQGKSEVHLLVDNPGTAKKVLDQERLTYKETEVAQVKLQHRPGELARVAASLGDAGININYAYPAFEPGTNAPVLVFGVADAKQAASILDKTAQAAA